MTSLRGRGSSSSKSLSVSVSNSQSSFLLAGSHVVREERDDIESYFSALRNDKRDQGKIDWEKLMESHSGDEIELDFASSGDPVGENAFLKPQPTTKGGIGNQTNVVSARQASAVSRASSGKVQQSIAKSQHVMVQSTEMLKGGSLFSLSSETSQGSPRSNEHRPLIENSYSDVNLMANIKMADDFLHEEDSRGSVVDRRITTQRDTSSKHGSHTHHRGSISPPSNMSSSTSDVSFPLKKNVFSIDQLEVAASASPGNNRDQRSRLSISESVDDITSTSEPLHVAPNLRNIHTLDELEVSIEGLHEEEDRAESTIVIGQETHSQASDERKDDSRMFRFNAAERGTREVSISDTRPNVQMKSPRGLEKDGYSDEEFESESLDSSGEEEEIAEEILDFDQRSVSDSNIGSESLTYTMRSHSPSISEPHEVESRHRSAASHRHEGQEDTSIDGEDTSRGREDTSRDREDTSRGQEDTSRGREDTSRDREDTSRDQDATDNTYTTTEVATSSIATQNRTSAPLKQTTRDRRKRNNGQPPSVRDASVQTLPLGSQILPRYEGDPSPHYEGAYLDPSPILPHVISPDTLKTVSAHSPSSIALNDMLRVQLAMTRQFIATTRQMAERVAHNVKEDYHYTTLDDTKAYIAKHRPKVLTAQEAKKLVRREEQTA